MDSYATGPPARRFSRRTFLKMAGSVAAVAGVAGVTGGCTPEILGVSPFERGQPVPVIPDQSFAYANNVPPPPPVVRRDVLSFFTPAEARTVEALTARLMPGTPEDPGAREAGVTTFIDIQLAKQDFMFWQPTYFEPPFAESFTGDQPPDQPGLWVAEDMMDRYGYQGRLAPREIYRSGLAALDQYSNNRFGGRFADLTEAQQDEIVAVLAEGNVDGFNMPSADLFFETVRQDTMFGMFSDPAYGGNRDMVGWRLVGYPGAQRAYTAEDMLDEMAMREAQPLADLHPFNPGIQATGNPVLPVSDEHPTNQMLPSHRHR